MLRVSAIPWHVSLAVLARCCPPDKVQIGEGGMVVEGGRCVYRSGRRVRVGMGAVVGMVRSMGAGLRLSLRQTAGHGSTRGTEYAGEGALKEIGRASEVHRRLPVSMRAGLRGVVVMWVVVLVVLMAVLVLLPPAGGTAVDGVVTGAAAGRRLGGGLRLQLLGGGGTQCWAGRKMALLRHTGIYQARPVQRVGPLVHHEIACRGIHVWLCSGRERRL